GYDVHKLERGNDFWIGGVLIDFELGAVGHSDADCLVHAIIDALLGAANLRDIGYQYPDNKEEYKGIDSKILLKDTFEKVLSKGYKIENIDSTIALQSPKISNYIPKMKEVISQILNLDIDAISIKATTTERLGFVGKGEGVSAYAVVLISK
ncbi:MAG: 2-C-methyl-D-erythritol 2,4-cyclodiphosphate synthase, partial [Bacteroidales bacterium]